MPHEIILDIRARCLYNIQVTYKSLRDPMYYEDHELQYHYNNESYTYYKDEMCEHYVRDTHNTYTLRDTHNTQDTYEIDDEYARDTCDYVELAYKHYA